MTGWKPLVVRIDGWTGEKRLLVAPSAEAGRRVSVKIQRGKYNRVQHSFKDVRYLTVEAYLVANDLRG
jgi:hypothetical protein